MILEIIIALLLGLLAGTLTGLFPGIHINLIAAILTASLASLQAIPLTALIIFIVAMSITHTFLDFIPSIFLGAPEEDSFLAILPGHQLLQQGLGFQAVVLTLYGSLASLIVILLFIPIFIYFLPIIFTTLKPLLPFILIFASLFLILREKELLLPLTIFILAGFLGLLSFNLPVKEPLLPLLTGLFGISSLIVSLKNKTLIPQQKISPLKSITLPKSSILKSLLASALTAPLSSFLPGMGSGQAAILASEISNQEHESKNQKTFLFLVGSINTIVMALSFITIFSISRSRTGAAAAIKEISQTLTLQHLLTIIGTIFISGTIAFLLGIQIAKFAAKNISKINYKYLSITIILTLIFLTTIFSNPLGLLVLLTASSLGVFTILSGARRINLMGSLLIPTILFYIS